MENKITHEQANALLAAAKNMLGCPMTNQSGKYVEFFNACEELQKAVEEAEGNSKSE